MDDSRGGDRPIFVTGATGTQGGAVARELLDRGHRVRALTRDPAQEAARDLTELGAEVVEGDFDHPGSLRDGLDGVRGVFSVQNFWEVGYDREVRQGKTVANAAADVGVDHLVYSSVGGAHLDTGISHFDSKYEVEEHIRGLDLPATILRPAFFMENWEMPDLRNAVLDGAIHQPLSPDTELQQIAARDIGVFAAMAFESPNRWQGRAIDISGDELTMPRTADVFSRVTGRDVEYVRVDWDDFEEMAGEEYAVMYRWFEEHGYVADLDELRDEHPGLKDLETYLREHGWTGGKEKIEAQ